MALKHKSIAGVLILLLIAFPGCIAIAAHAIVSHMSEANGDTATVQLDRTPDEVYRAEIRALEDRDDATILKRDPRKRTIEAMVGNDRVTSRVEMMPNGKAALIVKSVSTDALKEDEHPALDIEMDTCDELDIRCTVD